MIYIVEIMVARIGGFVPYPRHFPTLALADAFLIEVANGLYGKKVEKSLLRSRRHS